LDPAHPAGSVTVLDFFGLFFKLFGCNSFLVSQQGTFTPVATIFKHLTILNFACVHLMVIN
jgi:hypothetical protein